MVVGDVPYLPEAAPDCIAAQGACSYPRADVLDGHSDALARAAHDLGVPVIDLTPYLCTTSCDAVIGGLIVYQDRHHLTVTFARTLAPYVAEQVAAAR
jgi:hypothetical protein